MARRLKDLKELKIERPPRMKLSAKESLKRTKEFESERRALLPLLERARVEVYLPFTSYQLQPASSVIQSMEVLVLKKVLEEVIGTKIV